MATKPTSIGTWVIVFGTLLVVGIHIAVWTAFESLIRPIEGEKAKISLEALLVSAEQTLQASHYLEERVVASLKAVAREILTLPEPERTSRRLESICRQNEFRSISIYDASGMALESSDSGTKGKALPEDFSCYEILHGGMDEHVFGFSQGVFCESDAFGYARRIPKGGLIRIVTGVEFILGFEKNVGLAALVERFRQHPGVHILDLLDEKGHSMLPPASFTRKLAAGRIFQSRSLLLHGKDVGQFELEFADPDLQKLTRSAGLFLTFSGAVSLAVLALLAGLLRRRTEADEKDRQIAETRRRIDGLGTVVAAIAHEMRNPLNTVALSIFSLRADLGEKPESKKLLERLDLIESTTRQANNLVKNLLQTTRPLLPNLSEIDIDSWVTNLRSSFEATFPGIQGEFKHWGNQRFFSDPEFLHQIVWNLLLNSSQAGAKQVVFNLNANESGIEITVIDDGPGIPLEIQQNLFVPGCTSHADGTGLGLYNCQRRCASLGGTIETSGADRRFAGAASAATPAKPQAENPKPETRSQNPVARSQDPCAASPATFAATSPAISAAASPAISAATSPATFAAVSAAASATTASASSAASSASAPSAASSAAAPNPGTTFVVRIPTPKGRL